MTDEEKDPFAKEKEITERFLDAYGKIKKEAPSTRSKKELESFFIKNKEPCFPMHELSNSLAELMIGKIYGTENKLNEPLKNGIEEMRIELKYDNSSTIEKLLIDDIILGFFQMRNMQMVLNGYIAARGITHKKIRFADQMVNSAQRRFYKSIQTLTRLRKTGINLQINIATEGGKQVNIKK